MAFLIRQKETIGLVRGVKALRDSNKTAFLSLAAVLRLSTDDEATELKQNMVDFVDKDALAASSK